MRTHTKEFKEQIKELGRQIDGKIYYYPNYNIVTEDNNLILTETNIQIVSEQFDEESVVEIDSELIYSMSIVKNGQLLQSLMKELDFEAKEDLKIGSVINPQLGLLVNNSYEYLDYGNYIIYSKEFNLDTETWSYVCYDFMLYSMIKYKPVNITYPTTIRSYIGAIAEKIGIGFANANDTFVNYDQVISEDVFENKGYTFRDVLDKLSQITASNILINNNDELEVKYAEKTNEANLPNEYQQVEYISTLYTNRAYIDTGIKGNNNTIIKLKYMLVSRSDNNYIVGDITNTNSAICFNLGNTSQPISRWGSSTTNTKFYLGIATIYNSIISKDGFYINNSLQWEPTANTFTTEGNIYLFNAGNIVNTGFVGRIYSCQIYDGENLVRDFIPCYRKNDNEVGMFDLVSRSFFVNEGLDAFSKGNNVIDTINEEYLKDINVAFGETFGPINRVSIIDNDNKLEYYAEDSQSIIQNEKTQINIIDNELAFNGEEQAICQAILNKLDGLYYSINDFATMGVCYYDYLDIFKVLAKGKDYQCLLLNNEITINQGIKEDIFTNKLENTETSSHNYEEPIMSNKEVQFKINHQEGEIESRVEKDGVISAINQSAEEIKINANKLSFEGATIDMTADDIKIKGENLEIDSDGTITLVDETANEAVTKLASYIVKSTYDSEYQGMTAHIAYEHNVYGNGRKNEYENDNNITYSSGYGHYFGGLEENLYRYPSTRWYFKSADYTEGYSNGSYVGISVGVQGINTSRLQNGTWKYPLSVSVDGAITCVSVTQTSKAESKKNFEKLTNAKEILNATDIYKYNMIDEEDDTKKNIGFVIGDKFNYSEEITSKNNDGANIYSMVSVLWQVVKEQQEEIDKLKEMINNGKY